MEYNQFYAYVSDYLPGYYRDQAGFMSYLNDENRLEDFAMLFMMTLPSPRMDYYESSDFAKIKSGVLGYTSEIISALGLFPI